MNKAATVINQAGIEQLKNKTFIYTRILFVGFPAKPKNPEKIVHFLDTWKFHSARLHMVYIPSTPIGERAREFGIQGMGIEWKHDTMNSQAGSDLARRVVSEQKHSVHNGRSGRGVVGVPALRKRIRSGR